VVTPWAMSVPDVNGVCPGGSQDPEMALQVQNQDARACARNAGGQAMALLVGTEDVVLVIDIPLQVVDAACATQARYAGGGNRHTGLRQGIAQGLIGSNLNALAGTGNLCHEGTGR